MTTTTKKKPLTPAQRRLYEIIEHRLSRPFMAVGRPLPRVCSGRVIPKTAWIDTTHDHHDKSIFPLDLVRCPVSVVGSAQTLATLCNKGWLVWVATYTTPRSGTHHIYRLPTEA